MTDEMLSAITYFSLYVKFIAVFSITARKKFVNTVCVFCVSERCYQWKKLWYFYSKLLWKKKERNEMKVQ